jgi:hypothetical protein
MGWWYGSLQGEIVGNWAGSGAWRYALAASSLFIWSIALLNPLKQVGHNLTIISLLIEV